MPSVRKLSVAEIDALQNRRKGLRKQVEEEYDGILRDYTAGEYGIAELGAEENRLTVRNRLKAAANRRGMSIAFRRTKGPQLRFQVVQNTSSSQPRATAAKAAAAPPSDAAPKRRGGRPRKNPLPS